MATLKTLLDAVTFFSDKENCRKFMVESRWEDGIVRCPSCGSDKVTYMPASNVYNCRTRHPKQKFSLKVGTVMEDSPIALEKWLPAFWLLTNCKNGISSYELARAVGVTQKAAWHMLGRIRKAMDESVDAPKLGGKGNGPVEVDEAFFGGDPKNWHMERREKMRKEVRTARVRQYQNAYTHKTAVVGMIDRETRQIRAKVVPNVRRDTLQAEIMAAIQPNTHVYTDQAVAYTSLREDFVHKTVNHAVEYVNGAVHTNSLENFWSLLKRNLKGTYVAVEPFHLDRYLAEQCFRFNTSKSHNDGTRFNKVMRQIVGKKLTYAELTGKESQRPF